MRTVLRHVRLPRMLLAAAAGVAAELCGLGLMAAAGWLIARAAQQPPLAALGLAIVAVRGFAIFRGVLRYAERLAGHDAALRAVAGLRQQVFESLAHRPPLAGRRDGDALARVVSDVDAVQDLLLRCVLPAASAVVAAGAATTLAAVLLPPTAAVLAAGLLLAGVLVPAAVAVAARRSGHGIAQARAALASGALDLVDGARDLVAFGGQAAAVAAAEQHAGRLARAERRAAAANAAATAAGVLVQGLTAAAVALVAIGSGADEVLVAVLALSSLAAFECMLPLGEAAQRLAELRPAVGRVAELLAPVAAPASRRRLAGGSSQPGPASRRRIAPPTAAKAPAAGAPAAGGALRPRSAQGAIQLAGVRVQYAGAEPQDAGAEPHVGAAALDGVDLCIEPGRSVAVVGASGAGKSTLLGVLSGLVEPHAGEVDTPEATGLTQDAHVFRTTLRANLLLAKPEATELQLEAALRTAGLAEWIAELPQGLGTVVGAGGRSMSGGQRQRLLLARAVLADPEVLLLDEPTEGLHPDLADEVLQRVLHARAGRTTVVVTHRLTSLHKFDQVLELDAGRITREATGEEAEMALVPLRGV